MATFTREKFLHISTIPELLLKILLLSMMVLQISCQDFTYIRTHQGMRSTEYVIENMTHICLDDCLLFCDLNPNTLSVKYNEKRGRCACHSVIPYEMKLQERPNANMYMRFDRVDIPTVCLAAMALDYKYDREANLCYKSHHDRKTWVLAKSECEREGGILVKLDTPVKVDAARRLLEEGDIFIGGTDAEINGEWRWIADNSLIPNLTYAGSKHCLKIKKITQQFDFVRCHQETKSFVCEMIIN